MKTLVCAAALLLSMTLHDAHAINKCTDSKTGKVTYSDSRCPSQADQADVRITQNVVDGQPAGDAGLRASAMRAARVEGHIMAGEVAIGMTEAEVLNSWGNPSTVNTDVYGAHVHKQMVFNRANNGTQYVYTDNGLVVAVQSRPGYTFSAPTDRCYDQLDIRNAGVGMNSQSKTEAEKQAIRDRVARMKPC